MLPEQPERRSGPGPRLTPRTWRGSAELVEDREVEPAVVAGVARGPEHGRDALGGEVELGRPRAARRSTRRGRRRLERRSPAAFDVPLADGPIPLVEEPVGETEVRHEVRREPDALAIARPRTGREPDPRSSGHPAQVRCRGRRRGRRGAGCRRTRSRGSGSSVDGRQRRADVVAVSASWRSQPEEVVAAVPARARGRSGRTRQDDLAPGGDAAPRRAGRRSVRSRRARTPPGGKVRRVRGSRASAPARSGVASNRRRPAGMRADGGRRPTATTTIRASNSARRVVARRNRRRPWSAEAVDACWTSTAGPDAARRSPRRSAAVRATISSRGRKPSGSGPSYGKPGQPGRSSWATRGENASQRSCQPPPSVGRRSRTTCSRPAWPRCQLGDQPGMPGADDDGLDRRSARRRSSRILAGPGRTGCAPSMPTSRPSVDPPGPVGSDRLRADRSRGTRSSWRRERRWPIAAQRAGPLRHGRRPGSRHASEATGVAPLHSRSRRPNHIETSDRSARPDGRINR